MKRLQCCLDKFTKAPQMQLLADNFIMSVQYARDCILLGNTKMQAATQQHILTVLQNILDEWAAYKLCHEAYFDQFGHIRLTDATSQSSRAEILAAYEREKERHWSAIWQLVAAYWPVFLEA